MQKLNEKEVKAQSLAAFAQSGEKWKKHAKINGEIYRKHNINHKDLLMEGYGKCLVIAGMGKSLEDNIPVLQKYNDREDIEIACCDKAFKILVDNGIKPRWVFLADANIDYEKWIAPVINETKDVYLMASICANPKWPTNWKGPVVFYVNKDNIQSEKIFMDISGCEEMIPASSNVGNTAVVFSTQILGYKEYLLIGYDFGWEPKENYYAYNDNDKRYWMKHQIGFDIAGRIGYTSQNLLFSCRWLQDYFNGPVLYNGIKMFNCSGRGFLQIPKHDLDKRLSRFKRKKWNSDAIRKRKVLKSKKLNFNKDNAEQKELLDIMNTKDILDVQVTYCEKDGAISWA